MTTLNIKLYELEEAIKNPMAFKAKNQDRKPDRPRAVTYYSVLKDAIDNYHKCKSFVEAGDYLIQRFDGIKKRNKQKEKETNEQFAWYIDDHRKRTIDTVKGRINITIPLPDRVLEPIRITGQINRLDLNHEINGYDVWLFRSMGHEGWQKELRMILIQHAISQKIHTPVQRINIGIYSFEDKFIDSVSYTKESIDHARQQLDIFLKEMGV